MKKWLIRLLCFALALPALAENKAQKRLEDSTAVLKQVLDKPDGIPQSLLEKAVCVLVYPNVKRVSAGVGISYARGVLSCRSGLKTGATWSAPAMYTLDAGTLGVQAGGSSTDYVLLILSEKGADKILSGKLKLGAEASAIAGPSGASAKGFNDTTFNADVLIYSRVKGGLFAGASLGDSSLESDNDANKALYGRDITATQIVRGGEGPVPPAAQSFVTALDNASQAK